MKKLPTSIWNFLKNKMKKPVKIAIAVGMIVGATVVGYFGWKFINSVPTLEEEFADGVNIQPTRREAVGGVVTETATSTKKEPKLIVLSDREAFSAWATNDTGAVYYISADGKIYEATEGEDKLMLGQGVDNLISAKPSLGGERVLASFGDPNAPQWAVYDVIDSFWRPLAEDIKEAAFGKNEDEVYIMARNGGDLNLTRVDLSRRPYTASIVVKDFKFYDVLLAWSGNDQLLLQEKPSYRQKGMAWIFDLKKKKISLTNAGESGLTIRPVGGGYSLRFSAENGFGVIDKNGNDAAPILFTTLPQKCAAMTSYVYCFAPTEIPENIKMPDDYFMERFRSDDSLYGIDLISGDADPSPLWQSGEDGAPKIDAYMPAYNDSNVYFINRFDGRVYRLGVGIRD